ncbi:uncharacterized protein FOMMEDRAFT_157790 [Fomitiporia mediterranea MF3/22]|uniref:uncharacterized protein n=1 Tax=Fomitiporia mediterranea (strain MF3/22) TaxID=694068 RepID=UPI00044073D9|nr:uncharacterized protein FOMMEDRAFT_157790 [Fomitiporia mediterranea MF3/22]EJD00693.1 hypothetical protein FOMMEDRAFT_157790 [Fomitiporia mediterranea MF3/22]
MRLPSRVQNACTVPHISASATAVGCPTDSYRVISLIWNRCRCAQYGYPSEMHRMRQPREDELAASVVTDGCGMVDWLDFTHGLFWNMPGPLLPSWLISILRSAVPNFFGGRCPRRAATLCDELFEAQRLEPLVDPRKPKDPFFPGASSSAAQTNARNEREKDLNREAFAALTSPFTQARTLQRMEPRSPYTMQQSAFTFPRTTASTTRQSVPSASSVFGSSATTPTNALSRSNIPPPIVTSSPKLASSNSNRAQPTRPRSHAHTHSSDASAAAAGLLGLSISGGPPPNANPPPPPSSLPASSYRDQRERYPDPDVDDVDDNDDDSMYVFEMDETKERSRGRTRERGKDGDGMDVDTECVETAPTSVDSHASMESKMDSPPKDAVSSEKREPKVEGTKDIPVGSQTEGASTENDTGAEREVASSAENEGAEDGVDAEGEGTDGKRHTCPHCRKRFNRPSSLKIHLNTHTGAKRAYNFSFTLSDL